ncbi:MAG: adenylate kinase family protein [Thaumarchaeota archaeon]|nr:adenylate kinase family protein [Nitrososphaerota archaeon]
MDKATTTKNNRIGQVIGITGTPATGKRTIAGLLAKQLDVSLIDLNELAKRQGPSQAGRETGYIPDLHGLKKDLTKILEKGSAIVFGHLLADVASREQMNLVIVLRCSPFMLLERYRERSYTTKKAKENAAAEILDLLLTGAVKVFGKDKVAEIDSTKKSPEKVVKDILTVLEKKELRRQGMVDWLTPIANEGKLNIFFDPTHPDRS